MKRSAEIFGYEPYDGPLLEDIELYRAKSGEELVVEQVYCFVDRGGREMAIRPEMTPTLARMLARRHRELPKPIRFYSIPNLLRYERPQRGRLREHWQFNCDIFGAPEVASIVEILELLVHFLSGFGANKDHFQIWVNDRRMTDRLFHRIAPTKVRELYAIADRSSKENPGKTGERIHQLKLGNEGERLMENYLYDFKAWDSSPALGELFSAVEGLPCGEYLHYRPSIVRGMDYYTGLVFEVFDRHPQHKRALCGGGTYANLLECFNEGPLPGTGFGLGDVTLTDFLFVHELVDLDSVTRGNAHVLLACEAEEQGRAVLSLAAEIRKQNTRVITIPTPCQFKKALNFAEKAGVRTIGFLGKKEAREKTITLTHRDSGEKTSLPLGDVGKIRALVEGRK